MRSDRRRAQLGLLAAIIVLVASLAVLMNQGSGLGQSASPAALSSHGLPAGPMSVSVSSHSSGVSVQP